MLSDSVSNRADLTKTSPNWPDRINSFYSFCNRWSHTMTQRISKAGGLVPRTPKIYFSLVQWQADKKSVIFVSILFIQVLLLNVVRKID